MNFLRSKRGTSEVVRRKPAHADSAINLSETDGPLHNQAKKRVDNKDMSKDMPPDKQLEEKVLLECSEYLTENLPADDVAPKMLSSNLLTSREHDEYNAFKRSGRSMIVLSEYLLECLRKRQAGFLRKFCTILWDIEPASYLGDYIQKSYNAAVSLGGFDPDSRDRLSKLSCSDTDIRIKAVPQGGISQPCIACKIRKKQNRQLKEQLMELDKEYHLLYNAKIKLETQLETLQDMLQREEKERQNLTSMIVVPKLKGVITLIESNNRAAEPSGAQQLLKKMNDLMHEQLPRRKFHSSFGYSMQSLLSDTSSVVDIAGEEETARHNGTTNDTNRFPAIQNGTDSDSKSIDVPVVSNVKKDKPMPPIKVKIRSKEPVKTLAAPHTSESASKEHLQITPFKSQEDIAAREPLKEIPHKYIRSDSTPASDWNTTCSGPLRKPRHHSVSGATENHTKHIHAGYDDLSHSLKAGERKRKLTCPPVPGSQAHLVQSDELQSRLEKQRKKIESQS